MQQKQHYVENKVTESRATSVVNFLNLCSVTEQKMEYFTQ